MAAPKKSSATSTRIAPVRQPKRNTSWTFGWTKKRENKRDLSDSTVSSVSSVQSVAPPSSTATKDKKLTLTRGQQRQVRFQADDQLTSIIPVADQSRPYEMEMKARWYQDAEYSRFRRDMALTATEYRKAKKRTISSSLWDLEPSSKSTIRGIEMLCDNKLRQCQEEEREQISDAIEREINRQIRLRTYPCAESFREVSSKHSRPARERALHLGMRDAKASETKGKFNSSKMHWRQNVVSEMLTRRKR